MKKKGNGNLYDERHKQEEILKEDDFLDEDIEDEEARQNTDSLDEDENVDADEEKRETRSDDIEEQEMVLDEEPEDDWSEVEEDLEEEIFEEEDPEEESFDDEGSEQEDDDNFEEIDSYDENDEDESSMNKKAKRKNKKRKNEKRKKILIGIAIAIGIVGIAYLGVSAFFKTHFYFNTTINGADFSLKSVKDVEDYMIDQVEGYVLTIIEKNDVKETISGTEIALKYKESDEIEDALKSQEPLLWPKAFFDERSTDVTINVSYDETKLKEKIGNLQTLQVEQTAPVNAYPKYDGEQFVIEPEVTGTAVDREVLDEKVNQYITEFKSELNMMEDNCYKLPKYTSDSEELKKVCDELNKYLAASITYTMTEDVVVDKSIINEWISVDDNLQVVFNEAKIKEWFTWFGDTYDTLGTTRTITSPTGKTVQVSGGDYGWSIDEDTEYVTLIEKIKAGEVVTKEPAYYQTADAHSPQDWGSTYVEVDLSSQHMWLIQNGSVTLESDVVTGEPTPAKATPTGVYKMKEKLYGTTLVGEILPETGEPEYRTHVDYWMRVTWSGIGFHDATWQSAFGGTRYQDGAGSHGCINMPYNNAAALIDLVYTGMPVIIHY